MICWFVGDIFNSISKTKKGGEYGEGMFNA
jgi:hypothetical protein